MFLFLLFMSRPLLIKRKNEVLDKKCLRRCSLLHIKRSFSLEGVRCFNTFCFSLKSDQTLYSIWANHRVPHDVVSSSHVITPAYLMPCLNMYATPGHQI